METAQELYCTYEKEYKKITRNWIIQLVIITVLIVAAFLNYILNYKFFMALIIGLYVYPAYKFIKRNRNLKYISNNQRLQKELVDNLEIKSTLQVHKKLLNNKKRRDYWTILTSYLSLLIIACDFDEFEKIYDSNRDVLKSSPLTLKLFKGVFVELIQDDRVRQDIIFQHRFSRYHHAQGPLARRGTLQRNEDISREISQLYENQEYQRVIDKIEQSDNDTSYQMFLWEMLKERATYHLMLDDYKMPEIKNPDLLCAKKLIHLVETKTEYYYENANEVYLKLERDFVEAKKHSIIKRIVRLCIVFSLFYLSYFAIDKFYDNNADIKFASYFDVKPNNVYLLCENEELAGAIICYQSSNSNNYSYYISGTSDLIRKSYFAGEQLDPKMAYTHTGKHFTYVALIVKEDTQIYYDNELQTTISEKIPGLLEDEIAKAFIIDGEFELSKLSYK